LVTTRRFPPPWTAEVTPNCFIVRDANGQALSYVYYESEPGRRSAAKLLSKDEARVVRMLRAAVEREGGQSAFAKHHGLDRVLINMILNGKRSVSGSVANALGLGKVYVAE
jgi:hypothetical protein